MNESKAAANLRQSRFMKPVRNRWAFLIILVVLAAAGAMGAVITGNMRILWAWVLGGPAMWIGMAIIATVLSTVVTHCLTSRDRKAESNKAIERDSDKAAEGG